MHFSSKSLVGFLALTATACTSCPCDLDNNNVTAASTQEIPQVQVVPETPAVQAVPETQQEAQPEIQPEIQPETQKANFENAEPTTLIKKPSTKLSEQLSILMAPEQQESSSQLSNSRPKDLEGNQASAIPTAAEQTAKSIRA